MKNSVKTYVLALSLLVLAGITGCSTQHLEDRQLARGVKRQLSNDPKYKFHDVQPVAYDGTVQLTGFVDTLEQRQRAAEIAAHVKGVTEVVNSISLKPTPTGKAPIRDRGSATNAPPQGASTAQPPPGSTAPPSTQPQPSGSPTESPPTPPPGPPTEPPPGQPPGSPGQQP